MFYFKFLTVEAPYDDSLCVKALTNMVLVSLLRGVNWRKLLIGMIVSDVMTPKVLELLTILERGGELPGADVLSCLTNFRLVDFLSFFPFFDEIFFSGLGAEIFDFEVDFLSSFFGGCYVPVFY